MEERKNPFRDKKEQKGPPMPSDMSQEETEIVVPEKPSFSEPEKIKVESVPLPPPKPPTGLDSIDQQRRERFELDDDAPGPGKIIAISSGIALLIALLIAILFNTVLAPEVGVGQIENDSVTTAKIADQAVTEEKIAPGTLKEGPPGPEGPRGATGPAGPRGAPAKSTGGLVGVEFLNDVSETDSALAKSFDLSCPSGKKVLAGGAEVISGNESVALSSSTPTDDGKAWSARAIETEPFPGKWFISINITCARISK